MGNVISAAVWSVRPLGRQQPCGWQLMQQTLPGLKQSAATMGMGGGGATPRVWTQTPPPPPPTNCWPEAPLGMGGGVREGPGPGRRASEARAGRHRQEESRTLHQQSCPQHSL